MNVLEIESAVSHLAAQPFVAAQFPFDFLEAFGNNATTIKRLQTGSSNLSDIDGGILQRTNIHLLVCASGEVAAGLQQLKDSAATKRAKAKFILATDGDEFQAEYLIDDTPLVCDYRDFANHFGFFLPLAGIRVVQQIRDNPIDIKATSRLNSLYIELLTENEQWASAERRHDMNHFIARLIFCFFAEDTDIFNGDNLFTATIEQMSSPRDNNTELVISEIFRAMNIPIEHRATAGLRPWADQFPYVNGALFSGNQEVPKFSRIARTYLLNACRLNWQKINPDIFGSMIQAIIDDSERGDLGQHYTSVPNILKVLNPLFLDDLREQLDKAADNPRKLLNLRKQLANIRLFDPACGSGNFLVIAYKEMRTLEAEINQRRNEAKQKSVIPLTNFRGIEIKGFSAEIARLALVIAEYQCDVLYLGQKDALEEFLPLSAENWIICGNALRLDWLDVCPSTGSGVKLLADDLFMMPLDQAQIDFVNQGGKTYICGNPPYLGSNLQSKAQKADLESIFKGRASSWKSLDYVAGWFMKAADYGMRSKAASAFVSTNSICQGQHVPILWPLVFATGHVINFAYTSFKWANLASYNAGVMVVIVGISRQPGKVRRMFAADKAGKINEQQAENINAYLAMGADEIVQKSSKPISDLAEMDFGNMPLDGGNLLLTKAEVDALQLSNQQQARFIKPFYGSAEFIRGASRYCLWIEDAHLQEACDIEPIRQRIAGVKKLRLASKRIPTQALAKQPHRFAEIRQEGKIHTFIIPSVSSESREYLPVGLLPAKSIVSNAAFALYDAPLWNLALIASKLHLAWIAAVCGRLGTGYRYSNTMGWNTFPVPFLTQNNKADLTHCAENILLARETHFPATIAELYKPGAMPENLHYAHQYNDETLERIYIGRKFKNNTERLEKLFALYTKKT